MNIYLTYKPTNFKMKKNKAFTLAEVLITLGIIGVIAAITIPTLMQKTNDIETVTALKETFSILSQAYTRAVQDNGTPDTWGFTAGNMGPSLKTLVPYLKILEDCTDGSSGCFDGGYTYYMAKSLGASDYYSSTNPKLKLANGSFIIVTNINSAACKASYGTSEALNNICAEYTVDINGDKQPNQFGRDTFIFWLTKYSILPAGSQENTSMYSFTDLTGCQDKDNDYGCGCAAWVIYNENLDYLKCNNLNWGVKTKCN